VITTRMGDYLRPVKPSRYITDHTNQLFYSSVVGKSSTGLVAGVKARRVHLCQLVGNIEQCGR